MENKNNKESKKVEQFVDLYFKMRYNIRRHKYEWLVKIVEAIKKK